MNKKGQAALEFLMTYGWTILAAIISIAALWQFGLLNSGMLSSVTGYATCTLPPGLVCKDYRIGGNGVILLIQNALPEAIEDVEVAIQSLEPSVNCGQATSSLIPQGGSDSFFVNCTGLAAQKRFKGNLIVSYQIVGRLLTHEDVGLVATGDVEEGEICLDLDQDTFDDRICSVENDCDDNNPNVNPNSPENTVQLCSDGIDNDCDGNIDLISGNEDSDCSVFNQCVNADGDTCNGSQCYSDQYICQGNLGLDCNDNPVQCGSYCNPDVSELCEDVYDNNCNAIINENSCSCLPGCDVDIDNSCSTGCTWPPKGGDCNDASRTINPYVPEICGNPSDDNCNQVLDEYCDPRTLPAVCDADSDGYGDENQPQACCPSTCPIYMDCNDNNPNISPGIWDEYGNDKCSDGIDNDCDGLIDCQESCCNGGPSNNIVGTAPLTCFPTQQC